MACRAPVVASATGGILEVVIDEAQSKSQNPVISTEATVSSSRSGETPVFVSPTTAPEPTGHLVPFAADPTTGFPANEPQFARDLAAKITDLLQNPTKALAMGEAGRRRVEETFSWTSIAQQTIDLYKSLRKEK